MINRLIFLVLISLIASCNPKINKTQKSSEDQIENSSNTETTPTPPTQEETPGTPTTPPVNNGKIDLSNLHIKTQQEWDNHYANSSTRRNFFNDYGYDHGDFFSWHGQFLLRANLSMYKAYRDMKYLDEAILLIDHMFNRTDERREDLGMFNPKVTKYKLAPKEYWENEISAPGWSRDYGGGPSVSVLIDGRILSSIMLVVDYIKQNNISKHIGKVNTYVTKAITIIDSHDSSYDQSRNASITGGYYWYFGINGSGRWQTWSNPLAYNHGLLMLYAQVLTQKLSNGATNYTTRINEMLTFFKSKIVYASNGTCYWGYDSQRSDNEDLGHSTYDIESLVVAQREGYLNTSIFSCATKGMSEIMYRPQYGYFSGEMNGIDKDEFREHAGYQVSSIHGWADISHYDPKLLDALVHVLQTNSYAGNSNREYQFIENGVSKTRRKYHISSSWVLHSFAKIHEITHI